MTEEQLRKWHKSITESLLKYDCETIEDVYAKGRADTIEKCAKVVSSMAGICQSSCPIGCEWGTEESCVESWKIYLTEQLKENNKCIE